MRITRFAAAIAALGMLAGSAQASFHLMQIEQVIGGVNGDVTAQAIQLRMRTSFQNQVQFSRLVARDAAGLNPILLVDMTTSVPVSTSGSRILIASPAFLSKTTPATVANFTMTNLIPASYLNGGTLTFEQDPGGTVILWRLSWGGATYTGPNTGTLDNDANGNFGPPFAGVLPSSGVQALRFQGTTSAASTNNAADYALTPGAAVFVNNAGASFTVNTPPPPCDGDVDGDLDVDLTDLSILLSNFGISSGAAPEDGDLDDDDDVDLTDLSMLLSNFGTTC